MQLIKNQLITIVSIAALHKVNYTYIATCRYPNYLNDLLLTEVVQNI